MKKLLSVLLSLGLIASLAACSQGSSGDNTSTTTTTTVTSADTASTTDSTPADTSGTDTEEAYVPTDFPQFLTIASSSPGGAWYPINVAHNTFMEEMTGGVMATRINPGGSRDNVVSVSTGDADIGICHTVIATNGYNGSSPFEEELTNIRHIATLNPAGFFCAVRADSDIRSFEDLIGKRIGFYPPGNLCNTIAENIFDVLGYSLEDLEAQGSVISYLAFTDGPGQLADNQIDCYVCLGSWPPTVLQEIDYNPGIRCLEVDDELYAKLDAKYPGYSKFTIPSGTFQSFDDEFQTVGAYCCLICNEDMSDDMAYVAAKAFWENLDAIKDQAVDARECELATALEGCNIPVHPGAERYYKEMGILP